ncbi:MAG: acetyl-CoA decarbonylase/synthase complex subunit gamma [Methanobacteriota archaeon]
MAKITAMEAYKLLPKTNCKDCGEATCMSFALKLVSREAELGKCPHLKGGELHELSDKVTPYIRPVEIGVGDSAIVVGGEEVMYRHELKFFSPTKIFIDVSDSMSESEIGDRIKFASDFTVERMGEVLTLDGLALRCASDDPKKYGKFVEKVSRRYDGPIILCSLNAKVLEQGLKIVGERKPLVYAASKDNLGEVGALAKKHDCPLVVYSSSLQELGEMTSSLGYDKIILDLGLETTGSGLGKTIDRCVMQRRSALEDVKELGYPLLGAPAAIWNNSKDPVVAATWESIIAAILMDRYASLLIVHSIEPWSVLPLVTLRQCIYTDPRSEPQVDARLYKVGDPDENSPVLVTTNFSLTYFTVSGDVRKYNMDAYILVVDTKGFAVDTAVATGDLSAAKIKEAISEFKVEEKVKHRKLVIPLFASHLRGAIEDETGWEVLVGPRDSSSIQKYLQEKWQT